MKITKSWLQKEGACSKAVDWFVEQNEQDAEKLLSLLIKQKKPLDWANWTLVRKMTHEQKVNYAVFIAEQALNIFEEKYPDDRRPRQAIEAAKAWVDNPTKQNKKAADAAAYVAYAAYAAADAAKGKEQITILRYGLKLLEGRG